MYPYFKDRQDAALKLASFLNKYRGEVDVVLAVPRGGVPIAYYISNYLKRPLELLMAKKIGHPAHAEFAIGAVSMNDYLLEENLDVSPSYITTEIKSIQASLRERYKKFMGNHTPVDLKNKVVILIDDGMATGNTILVSVKILRQQEVKKIILAVPVAPAETIVKLSPEVDELICLYTPEPFVGVGLHYQNFKPVSDEEVSRLLKKANEV